jgi:hypothetical protein
LRASVNLSENFVAWLSSGSYCLQNFGHDRLQVCNSYELLACESIVEKAD